jgi:hypothetical protein
MSHNDNSLDETILASIGELLNIASGVAELQSTDAAAEEIYQMCDLVAEYFCVERSTIETIENDDGSFTTRIIEPVDQNTTATPKPYSSGVRLKGKPKLRLVDQNTPPDENPPLD